MTAAEQHVAEWNYRVTEYLGICRDDGLPATEDQTRAAQKWADQTTPPVSYFKK
jgi:hypothetical protein